MSLSLCKEVRKQKTVWHKVNFCSFGPTVVAAGLGSTTKTLLTCSSIQETEITQHGISSVTQIER